MLAAGRADAAVGSGLASKRRAPLLVADGRDLRLQTAQFIGSTATTSAAVLGGRAVVSDGLLASLRGAPALPVFTSPTGLVASKGRVRVRVGVNTTRVTLYRGSTRVTQRAVLPFTTVDFGLSDMPRSGLTMTAVASNPSGSAAQARITPRRLSHPWATGIVIDKSDRRLYWIRQNVLVRAYPIAIGRANAPTPVATWRIDSKYRTPPTGAFGPRKMRLYRQIGSRFVFTPYNIHGTNRPDTIGTMASAGCIRLYNTDVLELFPQVPLGTMVQTRE